jgi:hypothetical protein
MTSNPVTYISQFPGTVARVREQYQHLPEAVERLESLYTIILMIIAEAHSYNMKCDLKTIMKETFYKSEYRNTLLVILADEDVASFIDYMQEEVDFITEKGYPEFEKKVFDMMRELDEELKKMDQFSALIRKECAEISEYCRQLMQ